MSAQADLVLVNARVLTLDPRYPRAEAVAARSGRILAVGRLDEVRPLIGPRTEVVDGEGGLAVPAFHDAHCHLLSYARSRSRVDCRGMGSIAEIVAAVRERATSLSPNTWVRAMGYDDALLADGRHPDRHDLDAAAPHHAVHLQHRSLHLHVLNSAGLRRLGLLDAVGPQGEREEDTGEPTGRFYHAAELLRERLRSRSSARSPDSSLAEDVRLASRQLLARGVTSIQDATFTNGPEEWELFRRLAEAGDLGLRVFLFRGARHWRELRGVRFETGGVRDCSSPLPRALRLTPHASRLVRLGPVKFMLDEATTDPAELRAAVAEARAEGQAVAFHAVSEAEAAIALQALAGAPRRTIRADTAAQGPDRIEHGAVIPDALLAEVRKERVTVIGQPALVRDRGDIYRAEYPPAVHGWLHRAGSLVRAGIPYAASSDAPVTEPIPTLMLHALRWRHTRGGAVLGPGEALRPMQALAALTLGPAQAVGADSELGRLRPGAMADIAVVDPEVLEESPESANPLVRLTIMEGRVVWRRP